jgi:Tol biopolymer transport system component
MIAHKYAVVPFVCLAIQLISLRDFARAQNPNPSNDSWITFVSHRSGANLFYRMHPDGSELSVIFGGEIAKGPPIPENASLLRSPHWSRQSPNGRYFLSWAEDTGANEGVDAYTTDASGGESAVPQTSYEPNVQFMLYLGATTQTWTIVAEPNAEGVFAWSPDSKRFVFAIHHNRHPNSSYLRAGAPTSQIVVQDIDRTKREAILDSAGIWSPSDWSPDGKKLLLQFAPHSSSSSRDSTSELYELDLVAFQEKRKRSQGTVAADAVTFLAQTFLKELTGEAKKPRFSCARYSPDGKSIAAVRYLEPWYGHDRGRARRSELVLIDCNSLDIKSIAESPKEHPDGLRGPICWSPDGRHVLCSRKLDEAESQTNEKTRAGLAIWSIPVVRGEPRLITTGWSPEWR